MQTIQTALCFAAGALVSIASAAERPSAALPHVAPAIAQLAKLNDSGVSEEVLLAYVQNSPVPKPNAEELIYLHERGVSTPVITSLLKRNDTPAAAANSTPAYAQGPSAPASAPA